MKNHIIELFTPTGIEGPKAEAYLRGATGVWHVVLGAALALLLSPWLIIPVYVLKELNDIRQGGAVADSIEDAVCVAVGTLTATSAMFPAVALLVGTAIFLLK